MEEVAQERTELRRRLEDLQAEVHHLESTKGEKEQRIKEGTMSLELHICEDLTTLPKCVHLTRREHPDQAAAKTDVR